MIEISPKYDNHDPILAPNILEQAILILVDELMRS